MKENRTGKKSEGRSLFIHEKDVLGRSERRLGRIVEERRT